MADQNYPSNSNAEKRKPAVPDPEPEQDVLEPVEVIRPKEKETFGQKIFHFFFAMKPKDVGKRVWAEVVAPMILDTISDAISSAKDYAIFGAEEGDDKNASSGISRRRSGYTNYSTISSGKDGKDAKQKRPSTTEQTPQDAVQKFVNMPFPSREKAVWALGKMREQIADAGFVQIAYFYELANVDEQTVPWTDYDFGWTRLPNVKVAMLARDKYILTLPKAERLER